MDYLVKNLKFLSTQQDRSRDQAAAGKKAGVTQSAISKIIGGKTKEAGYRTVNGLAAHFGVSVDDLVNRDIEKEGLSSPSQAMQLDMVRLGHTLTAFDKALKDAKIRGRMGKLTLTFAAAYKMSGFFKDLASDPEQRKAYDEMVLTELRGEVNGQRSETTIASGEGRNSKPATIQKKAGSRR